MKPYKDPDTGKYLVRWRTKQGNKVVRRKRTFRTRKEAVKFIENLAAERRRDRDAARRTFNDYADRFLAAKAQRCKPTTVTGYGYALDHARAFLGDREVGTLRATDADAYLEHLTSLPTMRRVRSIRWAWQSFSATLDMVVRDDALPSNPAAKVDLPTAHSRGERRFQPRFLRAEDVSTLANTLTEPYDLLVLFAAYTGLRRAEVAGLNMGHVRVWTTDGVWRGKVSVEQTARFRSGNWATSTPKSERSSREVPLPSWLAERMHDYLATHPHGDNPSAPLWPNRRRGGYTHGKHKPTAPEHGTITYADRWEPEAFCRNVYAPAVARAGLGKVRFHDLRHTFASLCAANGIPVERVSAWMGHSSIVVTWTVYTHLFRGEDDHAAVEALPDPANATKGNVVPFKRDA